MNAHSQDSFDYQLADDELDAILANTHRELLAHVEQVADPSAALIAIMVDSDESELRIPDLAAPIPRHIVAQRLRALIETRRRAAEVHQHLTEVVHRARNLARDLDRELSEGDLTIAVLSAINFARRRARRLCRERGIRCRRSADVDRRGRHQRRWPARFGRRECGGRRHLVAVWRRRGLVSAGAAARFTPRRAGAEFRYFYQRGNARRF